MKFFLVSDLKAIKKENGKYISIPFDNSNGLCNQLKKTIKNYKTFVFLASEPADYEKNDFYGQKIFESFRLSKLNFKSLIVLDDRTKMSAESIIKKADFIFLAGGDVLKQNVFLEEINIKNYILEKKTTVVLGQSAGAMNLCENVYIYPEKISEIKDGKWIKGMGFIPLSIIPHFNELTGNTYVSKDVGLLRDFLLPNSSTRPFILIKDGSHIVFNNGRFKTYGDVFLLKDEKMEKLCQTRKCCFCEENYQNKI